LCVSLFAPPANQYCAV
jgi:AMP deaminase